jgi:hypothetical protein
MPRTTPEIESSDVPQAPNLARIRCVVTAIADGAGTIEKISQDTDISPRHVGYAIRAGQTLGLLDKDRAPTALGRRLLESEQESEPERLTFCKAIEDSTIMKALAPTLLSARATSKKTLGARIEKLSGLSKATAEHRASDLLAWREQLLEHRLDLPLAPGAKLDAAPAEAPAAEPPAAEPPAEDAKEDTAS